MRSRVFVLSCLLVVSMLGASVADAAPPPANDAFAAAQTLTGPLPLSGTGTTVGATREAGEPLAAGATPSGHSIWYRWTAPATEYISIDTCGSDERTVLAVYTGAALGALSEVGSSYVGELTYCRDTIGQGVGITFSAHAGTVYSIMVDGDGQVNEFLPAQSGEAPISVRLTHPSAPANDDFADAVPIEAFRLAGIDTTADNRGATREPGEPDPRGDPGGASVWFKWTAPRSGGARVDACGGTVAKPIAAVYTGDSVDALTPVPEIEHWSTCEYSFFATAGTTYGIAIDGHYRPSLGTAETFEDEVGLTYMQFNDDFADASPLGDVTGPNQNFEITIPLGNLGATKEPGEPDHAGYAGGASVWFAFKSTIQGSMQLSVCETGFPTLLAIYTGSSVDALTPVASASDPSGEPCIHNMVGPGDVRFDLHPGTTYYMAVDGRGGAWGEFSLERWTSDLLLSQLPEPPALPKPISHARYVGRPKAKIANRRIDQDRRSAAFGLRSAQSGARFRCKLDRRPFVACGRMVDYRHLAEGRHVFHVVAVAGGSAGVPATAAFAIHRR